MSALYHEVIEGENKNTMSSFEFEQTESGLYVPGQLTSSQARQLTIFGEEHDYYVALNQCRPPRNYMPEPGELLKDPYEKFPTPTDSRGFVDVAALFSELESYVGEDYLWRGPEDDHHEFWYASIYTTRHFFSEDEQLARQFRSLPIHILRIPRGLHDFLHTVTLPVEAPSEEVMQYRIESWRIACSLFNSVNQLRARKFLTNEELGRRATKTMLKNKFKSLEKDMKAVEELPPEFKFFDVRPIKRVLGAGKVEHVSKGALDSATNKLRLVGKAAAAKSISIQQARRLAA